MLMVSACPTCNYEWICELSTDNFIDNNSPSIDGVRYNLNSYSRNDDETFAWEDIRSASDSDSPSDLWESYYNSIATCNAVLEKVDEFEANGENNAKLQAVKGEALITRAYCHFMLANIFCMPYRGSEISKSYPGIPYITKPETTVKPHYERGTLAETYDNIQADLETGLPLLMTVFMRFLNTTSTNRLPMPLLHVSICSNVIMRRCLNVPTLYLVVLMPTQCPI